MEKAIEELVNLLFKTPLNQWPKIIFSWVVMASVAGCLLLAIDAGFYYLKVWTMGCDNVADCVWAQAYREAKRQGREDEFFQAWSASRK